MAIEVGGGGLRARWLAMNRFVCELCNKGFQREQNLQLHRCGHNLPWKLKQKDQLQAQRRRVYLCPEPTCVHHDPSRALVELTGIKKHYCRKHGEKKWKCDKCDKRYALQSDWKAHSKVCGTREYRCDCGTLFSRRDSFITHRAFCDTLAQESARGGVISLQELALRSCPDKASRLTLASDQGRTQGPATLGTCPGSGATVTRVSSQNLPFICSFRDEKSSSCLVICPDSIQVPGPPLPPKLLTSNSSCIFRRPRR
ncbi:protein indeterminate-domain 6, chloroplastic-like [Setaria italica]|uniref:protein indeterminate-domain 6, chloroplastic-like n=1 Tax=Setaria italica TaxID=4555 RepID=UPI000BE4B9C3|nr:protein indeterminate-domain 6, chloroplastic-like [Setaria italica]